MRKATGKVFILKELDDSGFSTVDIQNMAQRLDGTVIHLPMKYDLEEINLSNLRRLNAAIEAEIKRKELLEKLDKCP